SWGGPLAAALLTLSVIAALFLWLGPRLRRDGAPAEPAPPPAEEARRQMAAARRLLEGGKFERAAAAAAAAAARPAQPPPGAPLPPARPAPSSEPLWGARLLADLLPPLDVLLREAERYGADEQWQADFRKRYRGHAVLFAAEVRPDGRPALAAGAVAGQKVRV